MPTDERVLVIPTSHFRAVGYFHGFRPWSADYWAALLDARYFSFRPRSDVETDPNFKQLIPYIVLRHRNELFHYRRGAAGSEGRLHALRSVGVGGHVSEEDASGGGNPLTRGLERELAEELHNPCIRGEEPGGFVNDDSSPVGSVHLGVVYLFALRDPVTASDLALADPGFGPVPDLWRERNQFETWSQFVLDWLGPRFVTSSPRTHGPSDP